MSWLLVLRSLLFRSVFFFFFQAEDGIRDLTVTGVQTCALPISEEYPIQARTGQFRESNKHFFIKDKKNPYVEDKPFTWIQGDQVGGKSLIWGRQVYRWSDLDFEANLRDGRGVDWPIRYADIAPWYSYVER